MMWREGIAVMILERVQKFGVEKNCGRYSLLEYFTGGTATFVWHEAPASKLTAGAVSFHPARPMSDGLDDVVANTSGGWGGPVESTAATKTTVNDRQTTTKCRFTSTRV